MVSGAPLVGEQGYAAELGHTLVNCGTLRCYCGRRGCLETEVNLVRLRAAMASDLGDLYELDTVLKDTTDAGLKREAERQILVLAEAIANFISVFNPEVVVPCVQRGWSLTDAPTIFAARQLFNIVITLRVVVPSRSARSA